MPLQSRQCDTAARGARTEDIVFLPSWTHDIWDPRDACGSPQALSVAVWEGSRRVRCAFCHECLHSIALTYHTRLIHLDATEVRCWPPTSLTPPLVGYPDRNPHPGPGPTLTRALR